MNAGNGNSGPKRAIVDRVRDLEKQLSQLPTERLAHAYMAFQVSYGALVGRLLGLQHDMVKKGLTTVEIVSTISQIQQFSAQEVARIQNELCPPKVKDEK